MPYCFDSKRAYHFARVLAYRKAKIPAALRQVSTLPYRESDGFILLLFSEAYLFSGVGMIHLDTVILPYFATCGNGGFLQFLRALFVSFAQPAASLFSATFIFLRNLSSCLLHCQRKNDRITLIGAFLFSDIAHRPPNSPLKKVCLRRFSVEADQSTWAFPVPCRPVHSEASASLCKYVRKEDHSS